ncbi:helix-turn-helix transcriptional regulator [Protaetiibacter intestinalis]|uniref:LuxR family transcriptional regulator n=1 Tax=Protaetiibacter intestinalis TaxID=2419774 RepID=A0A387B6M1_9MICO|nr:helix-turn-helix transcriptional regulator [Protaetiibacter intestinalis]AYF98003.1 LuxR family transcriptional regulator [Protaetiibacter intestinalis]
MTDPRSPAATGEWPLVARALETGDIAAGLARQPARVQLLVGSAGVGKTVLASMVARGEDREVVEVIALAELAGVPLGAFGPALARLGIPSDPERAVPALMAVVGGAAERHVLLVDDIPRLDDVSAAAVYQLVRAFGVPTIATARLGERLPAPVQRMVDEGLTVRHDIAGLTLGQVGELLDRRFDARVRYADVLRLTERTTGNPLYLRVLVERAQRNGEIHRDGDTVTIDEGDAPTDLVDAMAARLADLSSEQRRLLRLAALLQPVPRGVLASTRDEALLLTTLEARGLLAAEPGTGRIRVTHPLISESVAGDPESHHDVADAVGRLRATGDDRDRLLAVRLQLKDAEPPPLEELAWAAAYAYGTGDLLLAAELSSELLARADERPYRCAALTTLASTRSLLGEHGPAEQAFAEAEELAHSPEELALVAVRRGEHLSYRRYDLAGAVAQAERIRARINAESDALDDSLRQWDASLDIIAGMPLLGRLAFRVKPELAIRSAILLIVSRSSRGDLGAARSAIDDLARIQQQIGQVDPLASAALGFARFVELICAGRVPEAAAYVESRRVDADDGVGIYTMLLGNLRQCGGRLAEAERLTTLAVDQLRWRDGLGLLGVAIGYQANAIAKQGRLEEARALLDAMTPAQRAGRHAYLQVAEAEAWILAHSGDVDGAVEVVGRAITRGAERGAIFLAALAACIPIRLGALDRAAELLELLVESAPTELEIVLCIRDLAVALRDRDLEVLPGVLRRVEASGQEPTVVDAIAIALRMRPRPELRRKLELTLTRVSATVSEPPFQRSVATLLTARELEVARAAAARERSKEIAARLGTSPRTVEAQLRSAYRKLGVNSRDALREALAEVGLDG